MSGLDENLCKINHSTKSFKLLQNIQLNKMTILNEKPEKIIGNFN